MDARTTIVKTKLADGTAFHVQATSLGGEQQASFKIPPFEDVTKTIESIAASIVTTLKKVPSKKATAEFGLEIAVESGALTTVLVQGSSTAHLIITLEWGE